MAQAKAQAKALLWALNHKAAPDLGIAAFFELAAELGMAGVELRNDIAAPGGIWHNDPQEVRRLAEAAGLRILSINALYPFNLWNDARRAEAEALADYAAACGAEALVLCPLNEGRMQGPERLPALREGLAGIAPILAARGLHGLVEALGFSFSSMRTRGEALAAIDELGLGDRFSLLHDTFHHHLAGETRFHTARTGLVHISGVEEPGLLVEDMRDGHRVLVGPADRLGNIEQLAALQAEGLAAPVSFEPFADAFIGMTDIAARIAASQALILEGLAAARATEPAA